MDIRRRSTVTPRLPGLAANRGRPSIGERRRPLRIAQVAPPIEPVPPRGYGGTERVVDALVTELHRRGHDVTTFASGDSAVRGALVPTVETALRPSGFGGDPGPWFLTTIEQVLERAHEFDVVHLHLEWFNAIAARVLPVATVATFHGRIDLPWARTLLAGPGRWVAISRSQAAMQPSTPWAATIHNGLRLEEMPFDRRRSDDLCFIGRIAPEKGILDAIEIAKLSGRSLRIAAKIGTVPRERDYHEEVFLPALQAAGSAVEFLGELDAPDRDRLLAESYASLMPGSWPEPFGLAAIESLACGTPVLARHAGALPEIIREGTDGFFGDDASQLAFLLSRVADLDRGAIRSSAIDRFSATRMVDAYEAVYRDAMTSLEATMRPVPVFAPQPEQSMDIGPSLDSGTWLEAEPEGLVSRAVGRAPRERPRHAGADEPSAPRATR